MIPENATPTQRVRFAILAARAVLPVGAIPEWDAWAAGWLDGSDRTGATARAVTYKATRVALRVKGQAEWAAAWAADAAEGAAAEWATWAADVATEKAQLADPALNLAALAEEAMAEP